MEMYCDVVPVYHSESLRQFPQLSAIAHNNFFYLAHVCLTLGLVSTAVFCPLCLVLTEFLPNFFK
jgi:Centromere/kinetochore Zw10